MIVKVSTDVDARFIQRVLSSPTSVNAIENASVGSTMINLNQSALSNLQIALPPTIAEQKQIARALSDIDALIEALEGAIGKKRQIKQGAMQELLTGKSRLPELGEGRGYKQSDVGMVPEDWDVVSMGSVGESLIGLTYHPSDVMSSGTLVLRSSNIQNERLAFNDNVYVQMNVPDRAITQENDILIRVRNGSRQLIGKCLLIDKDIAGSAFGAFMSVFRSEYGRFLLFQFQSDIIKRQINEVMGATINQITNKDLARFQVTLPPTREEQEAIATILSDMDTDIAAIEAKLTKTRQLKQGMMHQLLTGKIRLVNAG